MTKHSAQIGELHHASLQLSVGFERAAAMSSQSDQGEAMREASSTLIEMRRACDQLIRSIHSDSIRPVR